MHDKKQPNIIISTHQTAAFPDLLKSNKHGTTFMQNTNRLNGAEENNAEFVARFQFPLKFQETNCSKKRNIADIRGKKSSIGRNSPIAT